MSFKKVFLTIAVLVALSLVGVGAFLLLQSGNIKGLSLNLVAPQEVKVGVPFDLRVEIGNDSNNILKEAELTIELPAGIAFVGSPEEKNFDTKQLGTLGAGSVADETFTLIAVKGENSVAEVKATVSYLPANLGSRFEKHGNASVAITSSAINLDFTLPEKVFAGEDFNIELPYKNVGGTDLNNLELTLTYPPAYAFRDSSLKATTGNNVWDLGDLRSGSDGKLIVKGALIGAEGSFFEIKAELSARYNNRSYVIAEKSASIAIATSPLSLTVKLGGSAVSVHPGDDLSYQLQYVNNTDVALRDVVVTAKLAGEMFDFVTLATSASFRQNDRTLVWNGGNASTLSLIPPGGSGTVDFRIKAKAVYPLKKLSDKNFILKVDASIESPTLPPNVSSSRTIGVGRLETKVGGAIQVDARGFFRDAGSAILNKGPWPPKVEQATQFTIHWVLTNYATDAKNVVLKAFLGNNVRATGIIRSNISAAPVYNDRTSEMRWEIPLVPAGRGVVNAPLEAIFQVELTPASNQVGSAPTLLQETSIEAVDDFTGENLVSKDSPITTGSLDDPTVTPSQGTVIQ